MAYQAHKEEVEVKQFANWKDVGYLRKFLNTHAKLVTKKRNKIAAKHQRDLALAVKRARFMALLPYIAA
jgi:small subunit ribosomal protein S18